MTSPGAFEHIAITRLPELQTADGLFRALPEAGLPGDEPLGSSPLRSGAIVLLGLLRSDEVGLSHPFSTGALRTRVLGSLAGADAGPGELGLALWAESRADGGAVGEITALLSEKLPKGFDRMPLKGLAWLVSGLTEASTRVGGGPELDSLLDRAEEALLARSVSGTGLIDDRHHRIGGGMTPVSGQFHALTALCQLERAERVGGAAVAAGALLSSLLALQRVDGSWPGIIDPARGEAAALYPVFTVTQVALVHEEEARLDRAIKPRRQQGAVSRGFSTATRRLRGHLLEPDGSDLILDPEVSSEDLGWVLEAWAGR